ncbi:MAG: segregation/condensation protein A [Thermodesulfovibrionales bacterium]|nr:segregation/condensation protein A [Thermodesulfovibrionales bacterium]
MGRIKLSLRMVADSQRYHITLPIFQGPLDLLLHLIRENKIDIYDIPISIITKQYLDYIEIMKELNLEIAAEFIAMAATLIYIKSRMLLPVENTDTTILEGEDPRADLVNQLLQYQAYKEASITMRQREEIWSNIFYRVYKDNNEYQILEPEPLLFDINVFDLLTSLKKLIAKAPPDSMVVTRETLTVKDKINHLLDIIHEKNVVEFEALFDADASKIDIIITFLALLEIMRLHIVIAYQDNLWGRIWIKKHDYPH